MPSRHGPPAPQPSAPRAQRDDDALDLPPLDGEDEALSPASEELDDVVEVSGDAFDDATGEDTPMDDLLETSGVEVGWLLDSEDAEALELGGLDMDLGDEAAAVGDDEPDGRIHADLDATDETFASDAGEEGPLDDDEELREEDLPQLDADEADEEGALEEALLDGAGLPAQEELLWDDRAWMKVAAPAGHGDDSDDSGTLLVAGVDPTQAVRDAVWRSLEASHRLTAAALLPGGSVVVALGAADGSRARLVRILPDGAARIIAEVEPSAQAEDDEGCEVRALRWDADRNVLVATGNFDTQAFRPA